MQRVVGTSLFFLLFVGAAGCGAPGVRASAARSPGATPTCDEDAALELEAIRDARSATDPAAALRAHRAILAHRHGGALAEVEADASSRVAAAEHLAAMLEADTLAAQQALGRVTSGCAVTRIAASNKAPPRWAVVASKPCERLAQIGVTWTDARSVGALADELDALRGFVDPEPARDAVIRARKLVVAIRATTADRAALDAPEDAAERALGAVKTCEPGPPRVPSFVVAKDPSPRALTVVVVAKTPRELATQLEEAAQNADGDELASFFRGVASGRLGSGFVVSTPTAKWVVTNRHVVDLAESVAVVLEDGTTLDAAPVYIDAGYDLAVLAPKDPSGRLAPRGGFQVAVRTAGDGEAVTATGYPALLGAPSFQLTKGHVSNERLVFPDGTNLPHVQHTAAIDPGSSGGPLLGPAREVLGVNTFKLVGRESVNIAVPGAAVVRALDAAEKASRCDERCRARAAKDGCLAIVSELGRAQPRLSAVQRLLGRDLVAREGIASHDLLARSDDGIFQRFRSSPVATLSEAVARTLLADVGASGGIHPLETCSELAVAEGAAKGTIALADGAKRPVVLRWESARWVLSDWEMPAQIFDPATPVLDSKAKKKKKAKP